MILLKPGIAVRPDETPPHTLYGFTRWRRFIIMSLSRGGEVDTIASIGFHQMQTQTLHMDNTSQAMGAPVYLHNR